ncbi:hypothetical protein CCH79_00019124, partial [Gambusia affinis]
LRFCSGVVWTHLQADGGAALSQRRGAEQEVQRGKAAAEKDDPHHAVPLEPEPSLEPQEQRRGRQRSNAPPAHTPLTLQSPQPATTPGSTSRAPSQRSLTEAEFSRSATQELDRAEPSYRLTLVVFQHDSRSSQTLATFSCSSSLMKPELPEEGIQTKNGHEAQELKHLEHLEQPPGGSTDWKAMWGREVLVPISRETFRARGRNVAVMLWSYQLRSATEEEESEVEGEAELVSRKANRL